MSSWSFSASFTQFWFRDILVSHFSFFLSVPQISSVYTSLLRRPKKFEIPLALTLKQPFSNKPKLKTVWRIFLSQCSALVEKMLTLIGYHTGIEKKMIHCWSFRDSLMPHLHSTINNPNFLGVTAAAAAAVAMHAVAHTQVQIPTVFLNVTFTVTKPCNLVRVPITKFFHLSVLLCVHTRVLPRSLSALSCTGQKLFQSL